MITPGLGGCGTPAPAPSTTQHDAPTAPDPATLDPAAPGQDGSGAGRRRILLAYFSRPGENYHYGGRRRLTVGNTQVLAQMINEEIGCDLYCIQPADPYSDDYDPTVARNVREQDADSRPAIEGTLPDLSGYAVVLLASPIWNTRPPMIMKTFTEALDFTGITVLPVTTHAMSGLGTAPSDYAASCPGATIGKGLAIRGEEVTRSGPDLRAWLRGTALADPARSGAGPS